MIRGGRTVKGGEDRASVCRVVRPAPLFGRTTTSLFISLLAALWASPACAAGPASPLAEDAQPGMAAAEKTLEDAPLWENSLGMRFASVAGLSKVKFCVWETRVRDFRAFIQDAAHNRGYDYRSGREPEILMPHGWQALGWEYHWENPGFRQDDDHPVTCVSWHDARAFCDWLTRVERAAGRIVPQQRYRLPQDNEWSRAIGLRVLPSGWLGSFFESRTQAPRFPWGRERTPPPGWGNYAGDETRPDTLYWWRCLPGYFDGYPRTSPVGVFGPRHGDHCDLGGNVREWTDTKSGVDNEEKGVRGGSWSNFATRFLSSSFVDWVSPNTRKSNIGFRVVLETLRPMPVPSSPEERNALAGTP
ncbi:MAG: formylglycine-generating enzyme family protein [Kiritimatiellia bacterium]|nr:formylglycine-generating enzyme family protein [Kiritimatiellia bacterium]